MNRLVLAFIIVITIAGGVSLSCETDREVGGYFWTFHRMEDGNSFHECRVKEVYTEGNSLRMSLPCGSRFVDSIQIEWGDGGGRMVGTMIVDPGNKNLGTRDISGKQRVTWTVQSNIKGLELRFGGPRDKKCAINWLRVFYGKDKSPNPSHHDDWESDSNDEPLDESLSGIQTIDRIRFRKGPAERACRVTGFDGSVFQVVIDRGGNRNVRREFQPENIAQIVFGKRMAVATFDDGSQAEIHLKTFKDGMLDYDKKVNGNMTPKNDVPLNKVRKITFRD